MVLPMLIGSKSIKHQAGFTYIGLLMVVAIAGIGMAGVGTVWHQDAQREREKELLFIGQAYRKAIGSYYENSPSTAKQFPQTLQDLILDTRFPSVKRHIRQLYADPFARDKDWNLVLQQGKITGIYSSSQLKPVKKARLPPEFEAFNAAEKFEEWRFVYEPGSALPSTAAATPPVAIPLPETVPATETAPATLNPPTDLPASEGPAPVTACFKSKLCLGK
ncbi:PulG Type II secretory pathway, pseudopilin PulG [Methylophilaceae bacterium]